MLHFSSYLEYGYGIGKKFSGYLVFTSEPYLLKVRIGPQQGRPGTHGVAGSAASASVYCNTQLKCEKILSIESRDRDHWPNFQFFSASEKRVFGQNVYLEKLPEKYVLKKLIFFSKISMTKLRKLALFRW